MKYKYLRIMTASLLIGSSVTSPLVVHAEVQPDEQRTQRATGTHVEPDIQWTNHGQVFNENMKTAYISGSITGIGEMIDCRMEILPSSLNGDTVPRINLTAIELTFGGTPSSFDDITIRNLTNHSQFIVPGDSITITPAHASIPVTFNQIAASDMISISGKSNWPGSGAAPSGVPTPNFIFDKQETLLTQVYYMDATTGKEIPDAPYENIGYGMVAGDNVTASYKDLTANGWEYSGTYTLATPSSAIDGSGTSVSTTLKLGEINNTGIATTTGKQAIVFWYNKTDKTAVNVHDSTIYAGTNGNPTNWNPEDNFDSAFDSDGSELNFDDFIAQGGIVDDSNFDYNNPGVYTVNYTLNDVTATATITVLPNKTAVNVHDSTIYVGDAWQAEDNFDSALDKDGNSVDYEAITVDDSQADTSQAGKFDVTYTYDGVTSTATVTVKEKQTAVNVHDSTIYVGDAWQAEDNFDSALDKDGNSVDYEAITVDDSQADTSQAGKFDVTYTYDGVTSTATVTVKAKENPSEKESTIIVQYVDENGNKISEDQVIKGKNGEHYKTTAKKIAGYTLEKEPENSEGEFSDKEVIVVYTYKKDEIAGATDNSQPASETKPNSTTKKQKTYPKAGEEQSISSVLLGGGLIVLVGTIFFFRKKKGNE